MAPRPQEGDGTTCNETLVGLGLPLIHPWLLFSKLTNSSYGIWLLFTLMTSKVLGVTHSRHMPPEHLTTCPLLNIVGFVFGL